MTFRLYLAGPMTGYPESNYPAFHKAAKSLRAGGYFVFNPAEATPETKHDATAYRQCLSVDLAWICAHADGIAVLPGWEASKGACAEVALARAIGIQIMEYEP